MRGGRVAFPAMVVAVAWSVVSGGARQGSALPLYTSRTGLNCGSCHFDPNGGGPRNEMGFLYSKQRHDLTPDPSPAWAELAVSNRVGDAVFLGTNTRLLYLFSSRQGRTATDVSTFFQMQGTLYTTFRPHPNLTVVMDRDFGEFSGSKTRDLFGLLQDSGARGYVKVGRIRRIFGLRNDDHTAGTRAGFLRAAAGGTAGLLPYDPRDVESGLEAGASAGPLSLSVQLTNGGPAFADKAQTVSAKAVSSQSWGQVGASFYDSFRTSSRQRYTRWGAYGLLRVPGLPDLSVMGEAGFGTDELENGTERNLAATWLEADYRLNRALLLRAKYDFADIHRSVPGNASERFAIEGDFTPVPFADLKLGYRRVVPETSEDEHEFLAMWHFYF